MTIHPTASGIASALLGHRRVEQSVRVVVTRHYGADEPLRIVLVTPAGSERGEYYEVMNRRTLEMLRDGRATAEELELPVAERVS